MDRDPSHPRRPPTASRIPSRPAAAVPRRRWTGGAGSPASATVSTPVRTPARADAPGRRSIARAGLGFLVGAALVFATFGGVVFGGRPSDATCHPRPPVVPPVLVRRRAPEYPTSATSRRSPSPHPHPTAGPPDRTPAAAGAAGAGPFAVERVVRRPLVRRAPSPDRRALPGRSRRRRRSRWWCSRTDTRPRPARTARCSTASPRRIRGGRAGVPVHEHRVRRRRRRPRRRSAGR